MFPSYRFRKSGASTSRNREISQLSAGELKCQRLHELAETSSGGADIADVGEEVANTAQSGFLKKYLS